MLNALLDLFERHRHGIFGTVIVHAIFFIAFTAWTIRTVPLDQADEMRMEMELVMEPEPQEQLEPDESEPSVAAFGGRVTNATSNITGQSGRATTFSERRLAERVEQDLAEFERQEFERLAEERRERGVEIVMPELDPSKWNKELYMDRAAEPVKVEGATTVWHTLEGRHREHDVPGYRCLRDGRVAVRVSVGRDGRVLKATLDPAQSAQVDDCMEEQALRSALRARFSSSPTARDPQEGTVFFLFVRQ
jgi:uncharacterized iron-regulated membrane protein